MSTEKINPVPKSQADICEKIVEVSIDGIIVIGNDNKILIWNKQAEVYTGIASSSAVGLHLGEVMPEVTKNETIMLAVKRAREGVTSFIPAHPDIPGSEKYESHLVPVTHDGTVIAIMHILHDVSHRIKTENELKNLNESLVNKNHDLSQLNAALSTFSYITSREFRDPVRRMYTSIELLINEEGKKLDMRGKNYLRQIQGSLQRISLLAEDVLSFSQTGNITRSETDLNDALATALKRLQRNIASQEAFVKAMPLPVYKGHAIWLIHLFRQVFYMLLQAIEIKAPVISLTCEKEQRDHLDYLVLVFTTAAAGKVDEKQLEFCQKISALYDGWIEVDAAPGSDTIIRCFLHEDPA